MLGRVAAAFLDIDLSLAFSTPTLFASVSVSVVCAGCDRRGDPLPDATESGDPRARVSFLGRWPYPATTQRNAEIQTKGAHAIAYAQFEY